MKNTRRDFIKKTAVAVTGTYAGGMALSAKSYGRILGANNRIRVGIVGFSNRSSSTLIPAFLVHAAELNFEIIAVSDIWNRRRNEAGTYFSGKGIKVALARNNEELYEKNKLDAVIIGTAGFQVLYTSRMHNSAGGTKELYRSNGGTLNLDTNKVTSEGGLEERQAAAMGMQPFLLKDYELPSVYIETAADTGVDNMTSAHMRNWMECVRSRQKPNADVMAGYNHSIAVIMTTAALHTGQKITFDEEGQEVMAGNAIFTY